MNYKVLVGIVLVVAVSGCISQDAETPAENTTNPVPDSNDNTDSQANDDNTVVFTGDSFEPQTLTITQGETVTWVNEADTSMWIASNQHPTHTEYDGSSLNEHCTQQNNDAFDQCSAGDRFSFQFEKTGEFGYHNHQPVVRAGTVIVQDN